jgi:sigma-E factor negative regulatory protein RseC
MISKRIGLVNRPMANQLAEVITDRKGGCGGCTPVTGCRTCLSSAKLISVVHNTVNAATGDVVLISISNKGLWAGAVLFYLWPVVCLLAGAAAGTTLDGVWIFNHTSGPIALGIGALCAGVYLTMRISKSAYGSTLLRPRITAIVEKAR